MEIKKIGIVTFYKAWNNGAFLQAFALQKFLRDRGLCAEMVHTGTEFEHIKSDNHSKNEWWRKYEDILQYYQEQTFDATHSNYDIVIYGSDEIWNVAGAGIDPIYWGYRIKSVRKIAYAPCAGISLKTLFLRFPLQALKSLWALNCNFDAISVRDSATKKLVNKLSYKQVHECLDPTFLVNFSSYKQKNNRGDYVVIYSYGLRTETIKIIQDFCKRHNYKTIFTGSYCDWADENPIMSPFEWINLMYHAKMVFTSTFHGTVFSIICEREFYVVDTNSAKVTDLLNRLNLSDRILKAPKEVSVQKIDYCRINETLSVLRHQSEEFLVKNIF